MENKKILVVDDEADLTFLISEILNLEGAYTVAVSNSGKKACEMFLEFRPDIVFLDYVMPDVKGDEVLEFINQRRAEMPAVIVLMSGLGEGVYFKKNAEALEWLAGGGESEDGLAASAVWKKVPARIEEVFGVRAVLSKPFVKEDFVEVLRYVVGGDSGAC